MAHHDRQAGMVSILMVIFFMIFMSLLIVGFVKIMSDEQRQATDNDLSASALAAAQSGVEDGKRILIYCSSSPSGGDVAQCNSLMASASDPNGCDQLSSGGNGIRNKVGIVLDANNNVIVGDANYQQRYTCLLMTRNTGNVQLPLTEGHSEIVKLDVVGSIFDQLDIVWATQGSTQSFNTNPGIYSSLPIKAQWTYGAPALPKPALLRVQFIPYTPGAINLDTSERGSRTLFVLPVSGAQGASGLGSDARAASYDAIRPGAAPVVYGACTMSAGQGYSCQKTITGFNASAALAYYMRVTPYYADTPAVVTITPKTAAGAPVLFQNVQPEIDVTGRANDVFRRVKARVQFAVPNLLLPEYPLETAAAVCKNIIVADAASSQYCP